MRGSAPCLSSSRITSRSAASAAARKAVWPVKSTHASVPVMGSMCRRMGGCSSIRAFTSTPLASSASITGSSGARSTLLTNVALSTSMLRASTAAHSGVRPYQSTARTLAPRSISSSAIAGWLFEIAVRSGVMPLASAASMAAPRSSSSFADSIRPSRAAYSSGVIAPGMGGREPRSGNPPRTIPTPWPKPGTELGSTQRGVSPVRVRAFTSAPLSRNSVTSGGWLARTATISAVCWKVLSLASTTAPAAISACTASRLPRPVAVTSGASPAASGAFASAPLSASSRIIAALAFCAASDSGSRP